MACQQLVLAARKKPLLVMYKTSKLLDNYKLNYWKIATL